ncbi:MAG: acyloxyacyl hydrolase [Burkholderiales bacterium]
MYSRKNLIKILATAATMLAAHAAWAESGQLIDSVSTEFAAGTRTKMARIGVQSDWSDRWFDSNGTSLSGYWDLSYGFWQGDIYKGVPGAKQNLTDIGIDPVFRFENDSKKGFYAEGGIGAHRLSKLYDNDGYRLSTLFEFCDHVGVGYVFSNKWEVGAKIEHFSNGGYSSPNSGVNFIDAKVSYHY